MSLSVSFEHVLEAAGRLKGTVHKTPVLTSRTVDRITGCHVFFKAENLQRTGAFKIRGAFNALSLIEKKERPRGVLTYSSGNHAQAVALAGRLLGISVTIIMPDDAPVVKRVATAGYGAKIVLYNRNETTREALAEKLGSETGATIIPPYDHVDVVAGQGTAALELFGQTEDINHLLVCCGGGGLLSGSAISTRALSPDCRVIGVEPKQADDATRSFYSGTLQSVHNPDTIADGARTPSLGTITFPIVRTLVDEMVTVSEQDLLDTMFFLWERMKSVVEPTGALGSAALFASGCIPKGARVGVIISGGNVDFGSVLPLERRRSPDFLQRITR